MACKCKDIFSISEKKSKIHFITQITELVIKSSNLLKTLGFESSQIDGIITIEEENPKLFFEENFDFFNINFNDLEKDEIKIFIRTAGCRKGRELDGSLRDYFLKNFLN